MQEAEEVVDYAKSKGWVTIFVKGENVNREQVEKVINENKEAILCHYNHGSETAWYGSDGSPCIDMSNVKMLNKSECCYAQNCSSAKKLGVEAWKNGARYWGYNNIYVFTYEEEEYFKKFNNYGIKLRLEGVSWKEAYEKTIQLANDLIDELIRIGKSFAAACLRHDADSLVLYDESNPPKSNCMVRKLCIKLFGHKIGWLISRKFGTGSTCLLIGWGITVHAVSSEILSIQGEWIGLALIFIGFILISYAYVYERI